MSGKIELNGIDLYTVHGFGTRNAGAWWNGTTIEVGTTTFQDSYQGLRGSSYAVKAVPWPLGLFLRAPVRANREIKLDALRRILQDIPDYVSSHRFDSDGEVGIIVEGSTRRLYAVYRGDRATPPAGFDWVTGYTDVVLDLLLVDPAKYDNPETEAIATSQVEISLGTLPSRWEMEIDGPATDPAFIVYEDDSGAVGDEIFRVTADYTVGSGKTLTMDSLLHRMVYDDGATETDVTDTAFPLGTAERFRDLDSAENTSVWVALSTASGTLSWRNRWR